ncbi:MAG: hypothetical protein N2712_04290 [Brevinematales bacterium]|nr:hypothetical protein [Brevinematales bacterium]
MFRICVILVFILSFTSLLEAKISDIKVNISIPKNQITYSVSFESDGRDFEFLIDREVLFIRVNKSKASFRKKSSGGTFIYYVDVKKEEKTEVEIVYDYSISKEYKSKGIVVISETLRNLPYLTIDDVENINSSLYIEVGTIDVPEIFVDNKPLEVNKDTITIQRKINTPIIIGYLDFVSISLNSTKIDLIIPEGNESISLDLISFLNLSLSVIKKKFELKTPSQLNIIYYPQSTFSEVIGDNIIINKLTSVVNDYFSNIERLEDLILISHELLHLSLGKKISYEITDIIEGFIQYISIQVLSEIFGSSQVKDTIFKNYLSQLKYLSLAKDTPDIIRYRKYPLIYRYISEIIGESQLISFFKYLTTLNEEITFEVFRRSFRNITGINFDIFLPLFDGLPTLWNLEITRNNDNITIYSTAPVRVNTYISIIYNNISTNINIEINRSSSITIGSGISFDNVIVNPNRYFPELFYYDNYLTPNVDPIVRDLVSEIQYILNTDDLSNAKKKRILVSGTLEKKIKEYLMQKKKIFESNNIKVGIENVIRYNNKILVELVLSSPTKYKQAFLTISYGRSHYISDFSIMM